MLPSQEAAPMLKELDGGTAVELPLPPRPSRSGGVSQPLRRAQHSTEDVPATCGLDRKTPSSAELSALQPSAVRHSPHRSVLGLQYSPPQRAWSVVVAYSAAVVVLLRCALWHV